MSSAKAFKLDWSQFCRLVKGSLKILLPANGFNLDKSELEAFAEDNINLAYFFTKRQNLSLIQIKSTCR